MGKRCPLTSTPEPPVIYRITSPLYPHQHPAQMSKNIPLKRQFIFICGSWSGNIVYPNLKNRSLYLLLTICYNML